MLVLNVESRIYVENVFTANAYIRVVILLFIITQHTIICEHGLAEGQEDQSRGRFFQQLFELSDMVLEGYKVQLDSIKQHFAENDRYCDVKAKYTACRSDLLRPFSELCINIDTDI